MRPALAVAALACCGAACGYQAGFPLRHTGIRTVAVDVVGNQSFRQRLEIPLTRALHEALSVHSALVVTTPDRADARLVVNLEDAQGMALAVGGSAPIKEGALELAIAVKLLRLPGGETVVERRIVDRAEFRVPVGENLASATRESAHDLARKIVLSLEADF